MMMTGAGNICPARIILLIRPSNRRGRARGHGPVAGLFFPLRGPSIGRAGQRGPGRLPGNPPRGVGGRRPIAIVTAARFVFAVTR